MTREFLFLKDLKKSQDNWDQMREERNILCRRENYNKMNTESFVDKFVYGPIFYTLNKNMQEEFIKLLNRLEVTSEINNFVKYLGLNRERREYIGWLYKILKFLNIDEVENEKNENIKDKNSENKI
jgi:hypothetical protein